MVWCVNCTRYQPAQSASSSLICCHGCGKVVTQDIGSKESTIPNATVTKSKKQARNLNPGESLKFDVEKINALQRACTSAEGAMGGETDDGSESLSDIDDAEVGMYLLQADEVFYKKIIWERMNEEYSKAQAARKAAVENAVRLRKEKQQRKATEGKKDRDTAKTAHHVFPNKRTSSKVNYDALEEFLGEQVEDSDKAKKRRTDSYSEGEAAENSEVQQRGLYHESDEEVFYDNDTDDFF